MANYGYIRLKKKQALTSEALDTLLRRLVQETLDPRWVVEQTVWVDDGPVWFVELPGTSVEDNDEAMKRLLPPDQNVGFPVALQGEGRTIAFRHTVNYFEHWAQGRIEEAMADALNVGVFYDATDQVVGPGAVRYRQGKTFNDFLRAQMGEHAPKYIEMYSHQVPEGHVD